MHPVTFLLIPVCFFSLFLFPFISALQQLFNESSAIGSTNLYSPDHSPNYAAKQRMGLYFPDGGHFSDRTFLSSNLRVLILESKYGSVFDERFVTYYAQLRGQLENISVRFHLLWIVRRSSVFQQIVHNGKTISYAQQCADQTHNDLHCLPDAFLMANSPLGRLFPLTIPYWNISAFKTRQSIYVGLLFGGVHVDPKSQHLKAARFVKMPFNMPPLKDQKAEAQFDRYWSETIRTLKPPRFVGITTWDHGQHETDMKLITIRTRRLLPLLVAALLLFCTVSTMRRERAFRKPLLALGGVVSAGCAIVTSFGMLHTIGIQLIQIALITPFLVLWDKNKGSVRSESTIVFTCSDIASIKCHNYNFRKSIASILLTSLDNVMVFSVGTLSVFPVMRIFCLYCAVSLLIVFAFQVTLFGSFIVIDTLRLCNESVPIEICIPSIKQFSSSPSSSVSSSTCSSASTIRKIKFSGRRGCGFLSPLSSLWSVFESWPFVTLISLSYMIYVIVSVMILNNNIEIGLLPSSLLPDDSITYSYLRQHEKYFWEYNIPMEVLIEGEYQYSTPITRHNILRAVASIENDEHTLEASFWLSDFDEFIR
ncbi:unnamed protein product [Anisakis simplex]|uniref:Patched-related protein 9 (inferred by orthology to a C. elegans protein) n=1 Tax=Anisakis simplex TaxID=6269 RepID=A0A0M3IYD2_ANISI|nr:unnamed protein product [Anisakis simplex]